MALPRALTGRDGYDPSTRGTAIVVGLLFLAATLTFLIGDALIGDAFGPAGTVDTKRLVAGVALISADGVAVAAIGVALLGVIRRLHAGLAWGHLTFRVLECAVIFAIGGYMLVTGNLVDYEPAIYAFTGIGGLMLAYALYSSGLVPGWLARLGMIGYVGIALAVPSDLLGVATLDSGVGALFYVPGAVFELILPILLISRGFRRTKGEIAPPPGERQDPSAGTVNWTTRRERDAHVG